MRFVLPALLTALAASALAQPPAAPAKAAPPPALTLSTTAFADGGVIPNKYTYADTVRVSPMIQWTNAPAEVVTFALIMHDTDVADRKRVEDNLHWMLFNIPASATGLPEGQPGTTALPEGTVQARRYGPPGAPPGPYHHYIFELYGLDTKLDLPPNATRADVLKAMDGHVVAKASMTGRFHR
jgi:Raf kinase inhibitor-like YbhB/YbcL family protein